MSKRNEYLLKHYYDIDDNLEEIYNNHKSQNFNKGTIEYADNILFLMRCEILMGNFDYPIKKFKETMSIYEKEKDLFGQFFILSSYGVACRELGRIDESIKVFEKAHDISFDLNDFNLIVSSLLYIISLNRDNLTPDSILKLLNDAKKYVKGLDNQKIVGDYYGTYGQLVHNNDDIEGALNLFHKALKAYSNFYTNKNASNILAVKCNIANAYIDKKRYKEAIEMLVSVYDISVQIKDKVIQEFCVRRLSSAYENLGDYKEALKYMKIHKEFIIDYNEMGKNLSEVNEYLLSDLEEAKEKMVLTNLELKKKALELEQNYIQLNLISEVGKKLTSTTDEEKLFELIVKSIYNNIDVNAIGLSLVNEKERMIELKYFIDNGKMVENLPSFCFDNVHSFSSYCARENKDIYINDLSKEYSKYVKDFVNSTKMEKDSNFKGSMIYCRLFTENELIGILTIQNSNANAFDETIFQTMKSISSYVAIALSNSNKSKLLKRKSEELKIKSYNDELTKLENRRSFIEYSDYLINNKKEYSKIAFIIADMNHLKLINDNLGHIQGDRCIVEIANILIKNNKGYRVFRLSGDEFAVVMLDIDEEEVKEYIRKVKDDCAEKKCSSYPLSMAIGYKYTDRNSDINELFKEAETFMYSDKAKYYETCNYNRRIR